MAKPPAKGRINQAKARVEAAQKRLRVKTKPGAQPVPIPPSARRGNSDFRSVRLGLTIKQIMKNTPARTIQLMNLSDIVVTKLRKTQSGYSLMSQTVSNRPNTGNKNSLPTTYKQLIENLDLNHDNFSNSKWVKVSCTCPRFKFFSDYALYEKGVSDLKFSIDEPPDILNPVGPKGERILSGCKHLYRVFQKIVQAGI